LPSGCHCLCGINHPAIEGLCTGAADTQVDFWLGEPHERTKVSVWMCSPCAAATLAHTRDPA
jgi:hypothetical protein